MHLLHVPDQTLNVPAKNTHRIQYFNKFGSCGYF